MVISFYTDCAARKVTKPCNALAAREEACQQIKTNVRSLYRPAMGD